MKKAKRLHPSPRNRYHRRAKLSEYRFLKLLRGFAEGLTIDEAAEATRVSVRTVRDLYIRFREALLRAAMTEPFAFGAVGYFVFENDQISSRGSAIFDAVAGSDRMRRVINQHGARVGISTGAGAGFSHLLFETTARMFCELSIPKDNDSLYPEDIRQAYAELHLIALYIVLHKDNPEDPELFANVVASFERIMKDFPKLLEKEELASLIANRKPHRFSSKVLYDDLRRYLLKNPL
ncbi:hypothetical protein P24_17588 [Oceanibaculum indicum P24]|uniref:Uncharacterized protein n=2 Tax=Oceanibaculum indicum TaxID=526216 RepID=K2IEL0_9PROT|nr:hypothetical protein P24_17588 [Oceanibaculum indicum P24]